MNACRSNTTIHASKRYRPENLEQLAPVGEKRTFSVAEVFSEYLGLENRIAFALIAPART